MSDYQLYLFKQNRSNIIKILKSFSLEQLNIVPAGLNNNLIWHAGHLLLTHQFLLYHFTDNPMMVDAEKYMGLYGSGTKPNEKIDQNQIDDLVEALESTTAQTIQDWKDGKLVKFNGPFTSDYYQITINTPEEALAFNVMHEAFHFGAMTVIKSALV